MVAVVARVPLGIVLPLGLAVFGVTLWLGVRRHDFMTPPSATEIEKVRAEVAEELARPSALFAANEDPPMPKPLAPQAAPEPPPEPAAPPPRLDPGDLSRQPALDAWVSEEKIPAASFIDLASRLETDTQLGWALLAWERVLDQAEPSPEETRAAVNGIRRLRATLGESVRLTEKPASLLLRVQAPSDRLKLARAAAATVADFLGLASSGNVALEPAVERSREKEPTLTVSFGTDATSERPSISLPAPETAADLENALLEASFKLIAADLALTSSLSPPPAPPPNEFPAESLEFRITRLAWQEFARSAAR